MAGSCYEPLPRFNHISGCVGSKVIVQGGRTNDFSKKSRQNLRSVVEVFDPYSELWEQRSVEGEAPPPGTYWAASASHHNDLFSFGGWDGQQYFNTVHRLDTRTKTWRWSQLTGQNADRAPMPKAGCRMAVLGNCLSVFSGYGIPQGPTAPESFKSRFSDGSGWTNEFHIYDIPKSKFSSPEQSKLL